MNAEIKILAILILARILFGVAEVMIFRVSCTIAGVPRPGVGRSIGVILLSMFTLSITSTLLGGAVWWVHQAANFPLWEAGLVAFFIGLPVSMLVNGIIHAKMTEMRLSDGMAVWFVEKLIVAILIGLTLGLLALIFFGRG